MIFRFRPLTGLFLGVFLGLIGVGSATAQTTAPCNQSEVLCDLRGAVFPIEAHDPLASAVRISEDTLVTTRRVVADRDAVTVYLPDNKSILARVVPSDSAADVILLESAELPVGPVVSIGSARPGDTVFTIGTEVRVGDIRIYDPGTVLELPPLDAPLARLHHDAYTQPGHSGAALVSETGRLLGVVTSGAEGRKEAVSADYLALLKARSGNTHLAVHQEIGRHLRDCMDLLRRLNTQAPPTPAQDIQGLERECRGTGNRHYFELAAQIIARAGQLEVAIDLFDAAVTQDPNAYDARFGLAIALHIATRYEAVLPHLYVLYEKNPTDLQGLRLAIQAGIWGGDKELAERAYQQMQKHYPQWVAQVKPFVDNPPPRPVR